MTNFYPKGICEEMCPQSEIKFREKQGLLHILEIAAGTKNKADVNKIVKEFSRSAAGRQSQKLEELRTFNALLLTVHYLLHDVVMTENIQFHVIYDYIMDRLRAVRQDMVIQSFDKANTICLLQPIVKFYAYSAYRLCEAPIGIFDPVINNKHLLECLKRLLCLYNDSDQLLSKLTSQKYEEYIKQNVLYIKTRPFMESLYLVINLGNTDAIEKVLRLPKIWRTKNVNLCLQISIDYVNGNYVRVCKNMKKLPDLLLAIAVLNLPKLRRECLHTMAVAYNSKNLRFPTDVLAKLLIYDDLDDLLYACRYYGLEADENGISFTKSNFNYQKAELKPKHLKYVNEILNATDIPSLLLNDD